MIGDHQGGAGDQQQWPGERIIEFGPGAGDALQASLRVLASMGRVLSIEKVDGSVVEVVPVVVGDGQMLCVEWSREGGESEETVVVRVEEIVGVRLL